MDMTGEYRIPAPRQKVWDMLNDADTLRVCIPGCEMLEENANGDGFTARVTTKIGPVKATFNGTVTLSNIIAPEGYTISGEGKGGVAGFASGGADISLAEDGADTVLTYSAKAKVGGKLAQLGSRLVDSTARKLADQFFADFAERAGGGPDAATAGADDAGEPDLAHRAADAISGGVHAVEDAVAHVAHDVSDAAHHAEEELEKKAASSVLGGPIMWGLLAVAAVIIVLWIAS